MAAIDKIECSSYEDFLEFRIWVMTFNPSMAVDFYNFFMSKESWLDIKKSNYDNILSGIQRFFKRYPTLKAYRAKARRDCLASDGMFSVYYDEDYYSDMQATRAALQDEYSYMDDIKISIANFSFSHDKYLKWHCPIPFVREYLEKQCGCKTRWYHRLFFKHLPDRHSDLDTFWQKIYKKIQYFIVG